MLDHLAEFLGRAGPCCFLSLKPEEASLSYWPLTVALCPLGCPVLAVLIYQIHTPLWDLAILSLFLNFPLLHSCSSGRTGFFHRQNQCGPDDALWCPVSLDAAPNFRTVRPDLSIRHSGQSSFRPAILLGAHKNV